MSNLTGREHTQYVQKMFGQIAKRYDLLNRLMTMGQDRKWRTEAIEKLEIKSGTAVVDLGSGTGDIAFEITAKHPDTFVIASDFTAEMIWVGKERQGGDTVAWVVADAENLPFKKEVFGGVISGFLLRNVSDVDKALGEQRRVLNEDGRVVSLDTTPPRDNWLKPFLQFHLNVIIPLMGRIVAGNAEAYTYLPNSTQKFLTAESLAEKIEGTGFNKVGFKRKMLGTIGIHWGEKQ